MSDKNAKIIATRFVLAVPDLERTKRWWGDVMGFEVSLEPPGWSYLRRDRCVLHIGHCPSALAPRDLGDHSFFAYIDLDDIDAYYEEIKAKGAEFLHPPRTESWGMRQMGVRTPDGHRIMFAQDMNPEPGGHLDRFNR